MDACDRRINRLELPSDRFRRLGLHVKRVVLPQTTLSRIIMTDLARPGVAPIPPAAFAANNPGRLVPKRGPDIPPVRTPRATSTPCCHGPNQMSSSRLPAIIKDSPMTLTDVSTKSTATSSCSLTIAGEISGDISSVNRSPGTPLDPDWSAVYIFWDKLGASFFRSRMSCPFPRK